MFELVPGICLTKIRVNLIDIYNNLHEIKLILVVMQMELVSSLFFIIIWRSRSFDQQKFKNKNRIKGKEKGQSV